MFAKLTNEARIKFILRPRTPIFIKDARDGGFDPTVADMQFIRGYKNGERVPVIPGSSLKGVIRSHAERILRTYDEKWACNSTQSQCRPDRKQPAKKRYDDSCYACRLFGNTGIASRFYCEDAYPVNPSAVVLTGRPHVAINRITGAAASGALFSVEALEEGDFLVEMGLKNFNHWQLYLIALVLKDMEDGFLPIGGQTSRGYGRVRVVDAKVTLRQYGAGEGEFVLKGHLSQKAVKLSGYEVAAGGYYREVTLSLFDLLSDKVPYGDLEKLVREEEGK